MEHYDYPDWVIDRFGDDIPEWAEERWGDGDNNNEEDDDDDDRIYRYDKEQGKNDRDH